MAKREAEIAWSTLRRTLSKSMIRYLSVRYGKYANGRINGDAIDTGLQRNFYARRYLENMKGRLHQVILPYISFKRETFNTKWKYTFLIISFAFLKTFCILLVNSKKWFLCWWQALRHDLMSRAQLVDLLIVKTLFQQHRYSAWWSSINPFSTTRISISPLKYVRAHRSEND